MSYCERNDDEDETAFWFYANMSATEVGLGCTVICGKPHTGVRST